MQNSSHSLRRWIMLCEDEGSDFYVHVSPIKNLKAILSKGLLPNLDGGNYSGAETSLSGTYVTREANLIHSHINARNMENGFILVVVEVANSQGVIDEDALDPLLTQCIEVTLRSLGLDMGTAAEQFEPDDPIWKTVIPCFVSRLGIPNETVLRQNPDVVADFVEATIQTQVYEADIPDGDWWAEQKEQLVQAFPQLSHPRYGNRYSLRLPSVGYDGPTRIVTVMTVRNDQEKIVKGALPPGAERLIDACLNR